MNTHDKINRLIDKLENIPAMDFAGKAKAIHDLRTAIEAERERAIKAIDARFRAAITAACPSDYSYQYYAGKADAYDIAWQIIKGALNE